MTLALDLIKKCPKTEDLIAPLFLRVGSGEVEVVNRRVCNDIYFIFDDDSTIIYDGGLFFYGGNL